MQENKNSRLTYKCALCAGSRYNQRHVVAASGDAKHGGRNSVRNLGPRHLLDPRRKAGPFPISGHTIWV